MLLDVDGRTDIAPRGKGRWSETKCNNPGNALQFTTLGLAPVSTHQGVARTSALGAHARKHAEAPKEPSAEYRPTGKRPIAMEHGSGDVDAQKRLKGAYGRKKVEVAPQPAARERQRANATASETSEQRAAKLLAKAAQKDPSMGPTIEQALATGGAKLLEAERQYKKRLDCEQRASHQAAAAAASKPRRFADPANLSNIQAPFGNSVAGVSNNVTHKPIRKAVPSPVTSRDHLKHGKKQVPEATGSSSGAVGGDVPFDTTDSGAPYPAPPACGVRVPNGTKHSKRVIGAPTDGRDYDTVSAQRAAGRGSRDASGIPDFIFGNPERSPARRGASPARHQPVGHSLLTHYTNAPPQSARGSRFSAIKYAPTSLW
jgi:hypothetical protein